MHREVRLRPDIPRVTPGSRARGSLLLADISGYTGFLQGVADAHRVLILEADEPPPAYSLVSSLLDGILEKLSPPFRLANFEGDAVFVVATDDELPVRGADVLACMRECYAGFVRRLAQAGDIWTCRCDGCARIDALGLKFVLHHGEYVVQRMAGREELLGADVNAAHRLLKNHAVDRIGPRPYALLTDAAIEALAIPVESMVPTTEMYADVPPIQAHILPLG
jgi:Protein of unknown function (DUF2652)